MDAMGDIERWKGGNFSPAHISAFVHFFKPGVKLYLDRSLQEL